MDDALTQSRRRRIDDALAKACEFGPDCPTVLADAIRYAVLAPGKRLRPQLVMMAAEATENSIDWDAPRGTAVMAAAVAVELIHTYSLIHDDLPSMDDDDLRRGRPTVHIQFDPATAILAGDALQPAAFAELARGIDDPVMLRRCVTILADAAGATRLVGGQADDLAAECCGNHPATPRTIEFLQSIHRRKTGALFEASLALGCITGGDDQTLPLFTNYARHLGLAFQVMDDYLDATSDDQTLGKPVHSDQARGKLTYVALLGTDATRDYAIELVEAAKSSLDGIRGDPSELISIADFVAQRSH